MSCEHSYRYGGVRFQNLNDLIPGGGARRRRYFDFYFCEKCLNPYIVILDHEDTTYHEIRFGATPLQSVENR